MKSSLAILSNVSLSRFVFQKYDVTLGVEELLNVAHTIFVISTIQMNCNNLDIFAFGPALEKMKH